jgi:putative Holliday junction resolvase
MLDFSIYLRFQTFQNKNILAIDFGTKVIGTAFFRPGVDPFPYMGEKIINTSLAQSLNSLKQIIENEDVNILVLGIPYLLDLKETETPNYIKQFGKTLQSTFPELAFFEQDETLSTKAAKDRMENSPQFNFKIDMTQIDCVAATIILEDFIRS